MKSETEKSQDSWNVPTYFGIYCCVRTDGRADRRTDRKPDAYIAPL